jgi:hypothetical protein
MSDIAEIIMGQLHHTKPDHLRPGIDVGAEVTDEGAGLHIVIIDPHDGPNAMQTRREAWITYDEGADCYSVVRQIHGQDTEGFPCAYVWDLGGIVWGDEAKPYTDPTITVSVLGDDGEMHTVFEV